MSSHYNTMPLLGVITTLFWFPASVLLTESPCMIELACPECLPENMPLVTSEVGNGTVSVAEGGELALQCAPGRFRRYPLSAALRLRCERGAWRAPDGERLALGELGCQQPVAEDAALGAGCAAPLQARAFLLRGLRLAALCYDEDAGVARAAHRAAAPPPHAERAAQGLLANFANAFEIRARSEMERLFASDARMTRRLRETLKAERFPLGDETLTTGRLLAPEYFEPRYRAVAELTSNKVAVWAGVARGNLRHVQADVARLAAARRVEVWAGAAGGGPALGGGARWPVARVLWTAVAAGARGAALLVLNDPLAAAPELAAAPCASDCERLRWAAALRRHRAYARPALGYTYCCSLDELARAVPDATGFDRSAPLLVD